MPSRVHWVFVLDGVPRFDWRAVVYVSDQIRRRAATQLPARAYGETVERLSLLPMNFRKAIPILQEIGTAIGWPGVKRLRKFHLPKHLRHNKNPIHTWRPE